MKLLAFSPRPKDTLSLIIVELFERFSYYALQALLVLYLVEKLFLSESSTYLLVGIYISLAYATPILGGYVADKILNFERCILIGLILLAIGYFCLIFDSILMLYIALTFQIAGNALFKGNITSLFAQLFKDDLHCSERAFIIFYLGINIGSLLAAIIGSLIAYIYSWKYAFLLSGFSTVFALGIFFFNTHHSIDNKIHSSSLKLNIKKYFTFTILFIPFMMAIFLLLYYPFAANIILLLMGLLMLLTIILNAFTFNKDSRDALLTLCILIMLSIFFQALYQQAFMSLPLFTQRNIDRQIFGLTVPTAMFQAINPLFIIILSIYMINSHAYISKLSMLSS